MIYANKSAFSAKLSVPFCQNLRNLPQNPFGTRFVISWVTSHLVQLENLVHLVRLVKNLEN